MLRFRFGISSSHLIHLQLSKIIHKCKSKINDIEAPDTLHGASKDVTCMRWNDASETQFPRSQNLEIQTHDITHQILSSDLVRLGDSTRHHFIVNRTGYISIDVRLYHTVTLGPFQWP